MPTGGLLLLPSQTNLSLNVQQAYTTLEALHTHITNVLCREENDPVQLNILKGELCPSSKLSYEMVCLNSG